MIPRRRSATSASSALTRRPNGLPRGSDLPTALLYFYSERDLKMGEARRPHHSPYSIAQKGQKMRKPRWQAAHAIMAVIFRNWEVPNELCRDPLERSRIPVRQPPGGDLQHVYRTQAASHF